MPQFPFLAVSTPAFWDILVPLFPFVLFHVLHIQCPRVDIGASANLEVVDIFCYLDDMLSVDGDADAAVEARIRIG